MRSHFDEITAFRVAGDWCAYVRVLQQGSCAFAARPMNNHRRHDESVTISRFGVAELNEIITMQRLVASLVDVGRYREIAKAYIETLRLQFNLAPETAELKEAVHES
jgi:hypothetical protein